MNPESLVHILPSELIISWCYGNESDPGTNMLADALVNTLSTVNGWIILLHYHNN